jgi:iron complex outermembrane receptor protein
MPNEPLIVLDGLPLVILLQVELQVFCQRLIQMILNLYNSKDASAAAIYGSRAANGVIVITTKKGTRTCESKF